MTIKFKTASNLIIIPVTINGSDTLNFILDTGVRYPIITELPFINVLRALAEVADSIVTLAEAEDLPAHGEAVTARLTG